MTDTNRIVLKLLTEDLVTQDYLCWMQDENVTQFLESRWQAHTIQSLKEYVHKLNGSNNYLFGIFIKENNEHIGNIKIGDINYIHRYANLGILIGKNMHNKGYGTEAIMLATNYAFNEINLNKLYAGMYSNNPGAYNAFIKSGYSEVGRYKNHVYYKGKYIDMIIVEKLNKLV